MKKKPHNTEIGIPFQDSAWPFFLISSTRHPKSGDVLTFLQKHYSDHTITEDDISTYALKYCVDLFRNRTPRTLNPQELGAVTSLTGCLGMGGAERQMAYTMAGLNKARRKDQLINGISLKGPFEIAVRSLKGNDTSNFNLHIAHDGHVKTHEIDDDFSSRAIEKLTDQTIFHQLFAFLPIEAREGLKKLTPYFRNQKTDVAYLWQDGTSLHAGLAALLADVPRIVLNFRGLPPNMRPHLYRAEYQELYRSMAATPGVTLACNNQASADRYAEWIGIDPSAIDIIHNGVKPPEANKDKADIRRWENFTYKHDPLPTVIGSVFNFKVDKRPHIWVDFAAAYLQKHPKTLFVLVGDGKLLDDTIARAQAYKIDKHIEFVGASQNVGYWLQKMDAFVLLSEFEGLPNALIEAQMAGVPVVSTPAGGACDTFIEGQTGYALSCAITPSISELCDKVHRIVSKQSEFLERDDIARIARERFSVTAMLERTVSILAPR